MWPNWTLPIKNTFVHFAFFEYQEPRRSKSAPPAALFLSVNQSGVGRKQKRQVDSRTRVADPDEAALRDFAAQVRKERWVFLATRMLLRSREIAWRWNRMARTLLKTYFQPARRATCSGRVFAQIMYHSMQSPLDIVHLHRASVLRATGRSFEVWATGAIVQAPKVRNFICCAQRFTTLAKQCQIMLRLPDRRTIILPWEPDFPIGALQGKALCQCGLPPEKQCLQCLGRPIQKETVGASGVRPGDVIEVIEKRD
jgi:hypothetical protein